MENKKIILIIFSILGIIPIISGFISPGEELYGQWELANAILGNNIFFGALVVVGLVIISYYIWLLIEKKNKRKTYLRFIHNCLLNHHLHHLGSHRHIHIP